MIESPACERAAEKAVKAVDLVRIYGKDLAEVRAVDGVNLSFVKGCFTAVMGPSGSGKSTLLHCLAGLDNVTSGQVFLGDLELSALGEAELTKVRRDRIGFIFQSFNLIPTLTAAENITLPMAIAGRKPEKQWLDHVVERLGLCDRLKHRPAEMSGGQQQRVAAARALVSRPEVVFADEPAGNLDQKAGGELLELLSWMVHDANQTIVMVTHDPGAAGHTDRAVFLVDGHLVGDIDKPTTAAVSDKIKELES
ncbi:MAG: ABC transporter ATP-binding protein [Acidimicrobiales bacterium]|jgi:putative ABC transport system ATP-binding protein